VILTICSAVFVMHFFLKPFSQRFVERLVKILGILLGLRSFSAQSDIADSSLYFSLRSLLFFVQGIRSNPLVSVDVLRL